MHNEKYYLKPNVLAEPLVGSWYAWPHLLPPATYSLNVLERHLSIMRSYVQAPMVHWAAVKNPAMLGGPFVNYPPNRANEVKALVEWTQREQAELIVLAKAIKELDEMLRNEAKGFSLEPLYPRVPEPLRGYVELLYDLNNNPSFRLIERLLYSSKYYRTDYQELSLRLMDNEQDRPFVLSTPNLAGPETVRLQIPFMSPAIDELFKMKRAPQTFGFIKEMLGLPDELDERFRTFLTTEEPAPYRRYEGTKLRTRYFGHACILVEAPGFSILSDPVIAYDEHEGLPRYTYADLPDEIDYVVITHNHQDHILLESMLQLRHKVKNIIVPRSGGGYLADPSLKLFLQKVGFKNVYEIDEMETIEMDGGTITGIPFLGEHSDLNILTKTAYMVRTEQGSLILAADSCNVEPRVYEHVRAITGDVDVLFLGMECDGAPLSWLYGPLITKPVDRKMDHSRRLSGSNYERGIEIVKSFNCREAYVYAMGMEPWLRYIMAKEYAADSDPIIASDKLIQDCRDHGITAERLFGEKELAVSGA
ncbi:MAG TPA: MBL fold metallo-hydrolase [Thermoanaerobaculia bacterium]|nr:MBL fold metallo-hydrolase [Thermoanaerobaculia bacterium]